MECGSVSHKFPVVFFLKHDKSISEKTSTPYRLQRITHRLVHYYPSHLPHKSHEFILALKGKKSLDWEPDRKTVKYPSFPYSFKTGKIDREIPFVTFCFSQLGWTVID